MRSTLASAASALSLASLAAAQLDKPIIEPEFPDGGLGSLDQGLEDNLAVPGNTWDLWDAGWIPEDCKTLAEAAEFNPLDIISFNIQYDDCEDPWVMCRHKDSEFDEQAIVDTFGKLPVHFRSFVRHMIFVPGDPSAGSAGDNVQMNGELGISVFVHETAHSMDGHGFPDIGGFSVSQIWLDAYNNDTAVPDAYAQSSQQENFAQQTVVALYDLVVPDGIGTVQPNYQAIQNQYTAIKTYGADLITPGGQCTSRLENSAPVEIGASAKMRFGAKPDVSLSKNTRVIKPSPMKDTMELREFKSGKVVEKRVVKLNK
ncbi:hypothetical protein FQN54_003488 [Arachnomyces sp. PD_36]|nr:hypothetical protein FQN54_003488 [Arachnomyces sp. PD_36]